MRCTKKERKKNEGVDRDTGFCTETQGTKVGVDRDTGRCTSRQRKKEGLDRDTG